MSSDLLDLATRVVDEARGREQIEAFVVHERDFEVKTYGGEVESLSSAEPRGVGARVVDGGKTGFAFTTDLKPEGLQEVVAQARENARHTGADEAVGLAPTWREEPEDVPGLVDPQQPSIPADRKVDFALELERATRAHDNRVRDVEEAVYADSDAQIAIATSTGISASYRRTDAWCYSIAIAHDGDDDEMGFEFDLARGMAGLNSERVASGAAERAVRVLGATKIPSARMPVVFDPYIAAQFLGVIGVALTGEAVQKGRSLFAGRIDQAVAGERVTLVDDGRAEGAPGASPWDDEGVPTQRTLVIDKGILTSFVYDTTSARREGRASTGNASRSGFKSVPRPAPSNLAFESTGETSTQVLQSAGRALLVEEFHGVHSGANSVSGEFSVGATGRLLEDGAPGRPVKEVTVAAPMLDILKSVVAVGDDRRWLPFGGSYGGATTLIAEMTVGGS